MQDIKSTVKLAWWPTPQDYNEAVQIPAANLQDAELRSGLPYTDALGLPRPISGGFACVYRMHCAAKDFALRLFLRNLSDQQERYAAISSFIKHDDLPYTVTFDFLNNGIKILGEWVPALKMEWVDGLQLDQYIAKHFQDSTRMTELANKFLVMTEDLHSAGIAHGDLQHGNIIVTNEEFRLVDYDGMFVPGMETLKSNELGHANYQHPSRSEHDFGDYLDNFSSWVIYASLRALAVDQSLMAQLAGGDDSILFRREDFANPELSPAFAALERHANAELRDLGRFVRSLLHVDLKNIPPPQRQVPSPMFALTNIPESVDVVRRPAPVSVLENQPIALTSRANEPPDWLDNANLANSASAPLVVLNTATESKSSWQKPNLTRAPGALPFPPELLRGTTPRQVAYFMGSGKTNPYDLQMLAFLGMLGAICYFLTHLPSDPVSLLLSFIGFAIAVAVVEWKIWFLGWIEKELAERGIPVFGTVDKIDYAEPNAFARAATKDWKQCAWVTYQHRNKTIRASKQITTSELDGLKVGATEILLVDPQIEDNFVFYRFCAFHPK